MAKAGSFADKASKAKKKEKLFTMVKYVKAVVSEKTGNYRFQESMLKVPMGENVSSFLKGQQKKTD